MALKKKDLVRPKTQYGALPWREAADNGVEILLITSRETQRWVLPKGWPIRGLPPGFAALREAYEEAGVDGYASLGVIGHYRYDKRLSDGRLQPVAVEVYSLQVSAEHAQWPEQHQREKRWVSQGDAALMVDEPELKVLIAAFSPH